MTEEQKKQVATFRFGVICDLVNGDSLANGQQERLLRDKCARKWQIPFSTKTRIARSTILRWVNLYKTSGAKLEALYPRDREDQGRSRAIDEETGQYLIQLRKHLPEAPVYKLIEHMVDQGLARNNQVSLSTAYRFLKQHAVTSPGKGQQKDRRKFEAELPNDLWQSDVMHGPMVAVEGKNKKAYLIAIIDDHSRLVPHAQFYLSERLDSYLDCLRTALLRRGLPRKLYVDNGPAFRSRHLEYVTASLGIALIHSRPYQPEGKGKIERFFRTVRARFLAGLNAPTLADLNETFERWLTQDYHQRKHGSTGQSPFKRFTSRMECLRSAPANLTDHFRQAARRRVAKDRTVTLNGRLYEVAVPLIGQQIVLLFHPEAMDRVEVMHNNQSYGMATPVDLHVNCRAKRDKEGNTKITHAPRQYTGGNLFEGGTDDEPGIS
jgi:transposase InsO family protein